VTLLKGVTTSLTLHLFLFSYGIFFPKFFATTMEEFEEKTQKPFPFCIIKCEKISFFTSPFAISCEECKSLVCVFQGWKI
jgi:hypothetical protein